MKVFKQQVCIGKERLLCSKTSMEAEDFRKWMDETGTNLMKEIESIIYPAYSSASVPGKQHM